VKRQIRSEVLKLRSTRTTIGLVLGLLGLVLFTVIVQLIASRVDGANEFRLADEDTQRSILGSAGLATLFAILLGILAITNEFRHGTIRPTLLFEPAREIVIGAKGVASGITGLLLGLAAVVLTFAITLVWMTIEDVGRALTGAELLEMAAGIVTATLLWGVIGVGVGAVIRNQVGAIVSTIVWSLLPAPLLQNLYPEVGRFTPSAASDALSGSSDSDLLSPATGGLVLVLWAVMFVVAGAAVTAARDVP
jgi:ABC-type transport system involved in multi-copper enzyme maturation permease subunit